jgi:hypothetical protein
VQDASSAASSAWPLHMQQQQQQVQALQQLPQLARYCVSGVSLARQIENKPECTRVHLVKRIKWLRPAAGVGEKGAVVCATPCILPGSCSSRTLGLAWSAPAYGAPACMELKPLVYLHPAGQVVSV